MEVKKGLCSFQTGAFLRFPSHSLQKEHQFQLPGLQLQQGLPDTKKNLWFGYLAVSSRIGCISDFSPDNSMLHPRNTENMKGVVHKELKTMEKIIQDTLTLHRLRYLNTKMKTPFTSSIIFWIANIPANYFFENHCDDSETLFTQRSCSSLRFQYNSLFSTVSTLFSYLNYNF